MEAAVEQLAEDGEGSGLQRVRRWSGLRGSWWSKSAGAVPAGGQERAVVEAATRRRSGEAASRWLRVRSGPQRRLLTADRMRRGRGWRFRSGGPWLGQCEEASRAAERVGFKRRRCQVGWGGAGGPYAVPKLEPRNKLQLAKDLGLQPRQVSIWFQNKRARWKSKQMEQEYAALKANFDALYQQYESLKKENESLTAQFGRLNSVLETPQKEQSSSGDLNENDTNAAPAGREQISEHGESHERARSSNVNRVGMNEYFGEQEEPECNTSSDQEDSWQVLSRKEWCSFVPSGNLDDPCCPSSWWDFWM